VRASCTSNARDVFVAVVDGRQVGFAAVALDAFHEGMGVVEVVAVDPAYQWRGIASRLMVHCAEHMRVRGMDIAAVETGGDEGHAPARALYESLGYTPLPVVRYLKPLE
jgi:GNAT superfamily N-acetyltransferase